MGKRHPYLLSAGRGLCIAVFFTLLSVLISFIMKVEFVTDHPMLRGLAPFVINIFCSFLSLLILNSFALAFAYSDRVRIEEFIEIEEKSVSFRSEIKRIFSSRMALTEMSVTLLSVALAASIGAFSFLGGMFPSGLPKNGWFPVLVMAPVTFIVSVWAKYEAARYYEKLNEEHDLEKLLSPLWIIRRILIITVLYPIAAPLVPLFLFAIISMFSVFAKMSAVFTAIALIIGFAALILLILGIKIMRCISGRKKFFKKLLYIAKKEGYTVNDIKTPYRPFLTFKRHCSFIVKFGDKTFDCIMIGALRKKIPLVFTSSTDAYFLHRIGTKNHGFDIHHNIKFSHCSEGIKIIIVDPSPKNVFVVENRKEKRLFTADVIWKCTVHDSESFIGCMSRHCIEGRSSYQGD